MILVFFIYIWKMAGKCWLFNLGMVTCLGKGTLCIQICSINSPLRIDLVSDPTCAERLVYIYIYIYDKNSCLGVSRCRPLGNQRVLYKHWIVDTMKSAICKSESGIFILFYYHPIFFLFIIVLFSSFFIIILFLSSFNIILFFSFLLSSYFYPLLISSYFFHFYYRLIFIFVFHHSIFILFYHPIFIPFYYHVIFILFAELSINECRLFGTSSHHHSRSGTALLPVYSI